MPFLCNFSGWAWERCGGWPLGRHRPRGGRVPDHAGTLPRTKQQSASTHGGLSHRSQVGSSLTHYPNFQRNENKFVFNKRTIKACVSCCWQCPGTSLPRAAHLTVSLYLCSSGSKARGKSSAREGRRVSSKKPFKGPRWKSVICWEEWKRMIFSWQGDFKEFRVLKAKGLYFKL